MPLRGGVKEVKDVTFWPLENPCFRPFVFNSVAKGHITSLTPLTPQLAKVELKKLLNLFDNSTIGQADQLDALLL